jgi:peptidoglycan/LPS O-acetylase OafA/YrhL
MDKSLAHTHFLHSWSLATEEQFYLIWPAVILLSGRKTLAPVFFMLAVILAETILWYMTVHNTVDLGYFGIAIVSNVQPSICMGALLAYALHFPRSFRWAEPVLGRKWSGTVFFVAAAVILWLGNVPNFFLYLAMVGMVGSVCIREHHPLRWLLSNRAVVYIGTISYGMYMLNQLCRNAVTMRLHVYNQFLYFLVTAGLTVLLATLSYFFFEQQFLRIKDRFRRVEAKPDYVVPTVPA